MRLSMIARIMKAVRGLCYLLRPKAQADSNTNLGLDHFAIVRNRIQILLTIGISTIRVF